MDLRSRWEQAVDQFAGSDPGLLRLRIAARGALSLGVAILAEYLFVQATGALQQPGHSASVAAGNHDLLLIAMLLGAMMGMATAIAVNDNTPGRLAVSLAIVPFPMTAALAFSLALGGHRSLILASFAVFLGLAGLARRWGPRGTVIGVPIFIGDLVGFFLHGVVPVSGLGWLAAEIGVGAVACLFVRLVLFRPDPADELRRAQRSWAARARTVARLAAEATASAAPGRAAAPTAEQRLRRQLARLNEASLIIDAHLAEPGAVRPGSSARQLHDRLFEAELGITNTARFAVALAGEPLEADARAEVDAALACLREGDTAGAAEVGHRIFDRLAATAADDLTGPGGRLRGALRRRRVLLHRFATSVSLLGDSLRDWELVGGDVGGKGDIFSPAVGLAGGWLPGSRDVSNRASRAPGARWDERLPLPPYVRSAVQLAVSIGGATAAGDALDPTRFYWAVIAAFVTFTGVNTSAEQLRKASQRVVGTVVGILLGSLVARVTGTHIAADVVAIMVFLFLGLYLFRLSYTAFVVGVTIILSELYQQLHELSGSFLLMRLAETAVGSAVAAVTVFVVLPLRTRRVLDLARRDLLGATRDLVVEAGDRLASEEQRAVVLAEEARVVDSAYQSLAMTAAPLRRLGEVGRRTQRMMVAAGALRHYCDNLAVDVPPAELPPGVDVVRAEQVLLASLDGMLVDGPVRPYVRSASEWSAVEQQALDALRRAAASGAGTAGDVVAVIMSARDLQLLDGALAELARLQGAEVRSLDTEALDEDVGATRDGP